MSTLLQDVRFSLRMLVKNPAFTAVAVFTLAVGIGANTAIFSYVDAMLIRPFAFRDLNRAVAVWETAPKQDRDHVAVAPANFEDWQERSQSFEMLAGSVPWSANLTGGGVAERVEGCQVTSDFFPLLGITAALGRSLAAGDFSPDRDHVIVLSHALWQRTLGADPRVVGKTLVLNGESFTVIGVMPADFDFPVGTEAWAPLDLNAAVKADRADHYLGVIGRLKVGVSSEKAQADLATIAARLAQEFPQTNSGHSVRVINLVDDVAQGSRQFLTVLMGASFFVLLLACANVANLQLARGAGRQKEIAVRRAVGASRLRIMRQLVVESVMLSLGGGAGGLLVSTWGVAYLRQDIPPFIVQHIPGLKHVQVDPMVLVFTLAAALVAGILSGLAPALQISQPDLNATLKEGSRGGTSAPAHHRLRAGLVVSEVSLALVLLVAAGFLGKGFRHMLNSDPGFDRTHVLTFNIALPKSEFRDNATINQYYSQLLLRLHGLPGVQSATEATTIPGAWSWNQTFYTAQDQPPSAPGEFRVALEQSVTPDFLKTIRVPLLQGRFISTADGQDSPPVVVLSQSLAHHIWPNQEALGKRIEFGKDHAVGPWRTVVGIVGDIKQAQFDTDPHPTAYFPFEQLPQASAGVMIRVNGDALSFAPAAREQARLVDPTVPAFGIRTLSQMVSDNVSGVEGASRMMVIDGVIAMLLAASGIFALMSYSVSQRSHEIGVRIALGARPRDIFRLVTFEALMLAAIGLAIGVPVALGLTKAISSFIFGTLALDFPIFAGMVGLLAAVAVLAAYLPARRGTKVDPITALRCE